MTSISPKYLYSFKYDYHHEALCKLESRQLFNAEPQNKILFSSTKIDSSISPFIKTRLEILHSNKSYDSLLNFIEEQKIKVEGFSVEYLLLDNDPAERPERRQRQKDIGCLIEGFPNFEKPTVLYSICRLHGIWHFGILTKQDTKWHEHNNKPYSFSSSICIRIAKTLVSIASKGNKSKSLIDTCCGVGTIMLEACVSGFSIEGCDINPKTCNHARLNLKHFLFDAKVHYCDIKNLNSNYAAAIIDLPYNLYSESSESVTENIISSTAKIAQRVIIVSTINIQKTIKNSNLKVLDSCFVKKRGKTNFERIVWVCAAQKNDSEK